jgi:hypothetical protein
MTRRRAARSGVFVFGAQRLRQTTAVIASEARQSSRTVVLDCRASLAMTNQVKVRT